MGNQNDNTTETAGRPERLAKDLDKTLKVLYQVDAMAAVLANIDSENIDPEPGAPNSIDFENFAWAIRELLGPTYQYVQDATKALEGGAEATREEIRAMRREAEGLQDGKIINAHDVPKLVELHRTATQDMRKLMLRLACDAETGDMVGVIVIPIFGKDCHKRKYQLSLAGSCARSPTMALGALNACQYVLQEHALRDAGLL